MIKDGSSLCANYCREYRRTADGCLDVPRWTSVDRQGKARGANVLLQDLSKSQ